VVSGPDGRDPRIAIFIQHPKKTKSENLAPRVFSAKLMHLKLRILNIDILKVAPIKFSNKNGVKNLMR
jgi:hypothetical protein